MSLTTCPWTVLAANDHPEPSCEADMYDEVECGAPVTMGSADSWHCAHGHQHVSMFDGVVAHNLHNLEAEAAAERADR